MRWLNCTTTLFFRHNFPNWEIW